MLRDEPQAVAARADRAAAAVAADAVDPTALRSAYADNVSNNMDIASDNLKKING